MDTQKQPANPRREDELKENKPGTENTNVKPDQLSNDKTENEDDDAMWDADGSDGGSAADGADA